MKKIVFAILLCVLYASASFGAATRYYLPSSGAAAVSPAFDANWGDTTSAVRIKMVTTKSNTALTDQSVVVSHPSISLFKQFVSDPIGVVNFNGMTVSWVIRGSSNSAGTQFGAFALYLYHADTTETTLLASGDFGSAYSTTAATTIKGATSLANVSSLNGDRIVFEVGADNSNSSNRTIVQRFGDPSATADFALTTNLTTDLCPWIEFSATIPAPGGGHLLPLTGGGK